MGPCFAVHSKSECVRRRLAMFLLGVRDGILVLLFGRRAQPHRGALRDDCDLRFVSRRFGRVCLVCDKVIAFAVNARVREHVERNVPRPISCFGAAAVFSVALPNIGRIGLGVESPTRLRTIRMRTARPCSCGRMEKQSSHGLTTVVEAIAARKALPPSTTLSPVIRSPFGPKRSMTSSGCTRSGIRSWKWVSTAISPGGQSEISILAENRPSSI